MSEDLLKENLRKLAEVGMDIEEMSRFERIFERMSDLEMNMQRLQDEIKSLARESEVKDLRGELERIYAFKDALERRLDMVDESIRRQISHLAEVDAGIIEELGNVKRMFEKLNELSVEVEKLSTAGFVDERKLEDVRTSLLAKFEELRKMMESRLVSQGLAIQRLSEILQNAATKDELEKLPKEEGIDLMRDRIGKIESSVSKVEELLRDNVAKLSQVDSKIIDQLNRVERSLDRIGEIETALRRAVEGMKDFVKKGEVDDMRSELEGRMGSIGAAVTRIETLVGDVKDLRRRMEEVSSRIELGGFERRIKELDEKLKELRTAVDEIRRENERIRGDIGRLSKVDSEIISELGRMRELSAKLGEHDVAIRKLMEASGAFARRDEMEKLLETIYEKESRKEAVESEVQELTQMIEALKKDYGSGVISKESYQDALRGGIRKLERLAVLDPKVNDILVTLKEELKRTEEAR